MNRLPIAALAGLLLSTAASPVLADDLKEVRFKADKTDLQVGESVNLAIGYFENGLLTAHDSGRVVVTNPSGIVALTPLSSGFNQVTYFRMTGLRAGACRVDIVLTPPCGCVQRNSFSISVREAPRPELHQIRILRIDPCGTRTDVSGQTVALFPGERVEFQAIGLDCLGRQVHLEANLCLSGSMRGFQLEDLGAGRVAITARGSHRWMRQGQLVAADLAGSGLSATVALVVAR